MTPVDMVAEREGNLENKLEERGDKYQNSREFLILA